MARPLVSAADIGGAPPGDYLVPAGAVVTPLARDLARDRGIRLVELDGSAPVPADDGLEARVRRLVAALLATESAAAPSGAGRQVKAVDHRGVVMEPFGFPGPSPEQQVHTTDVVTSQDGSPMAVGYMSLTAGEFPWTLGYDEVQVVLEGELHIGSPTGTRIGRPGDVIYVPKGSSITFGTPSWTRFVYITFPADWAG